MKAFLLTAGLGTRLMPITNTLPKCLVEIGGKPLIHWWFDAMEQAGITEVLINLHHFPQQVKDFVTNFETSIKVDYFMEETLLGSAGTLLVNYDFVKNEKSFFIIYSDNLTSIKLKDFFEFHSAQAHLFSMALFTTSNPTACGIAALDAKKTIIDFVEKPTNPTSHLANAGIYIAHPSVIKLIPANKIPADIGFDLLPQLINQMSGWENNDYLIDIGTHVNLAKARKEWPLRK
jgi:mannose-1-phosphate guanylyltransferase